MIRQFQDSSSNTRQSFSSGSSRFAGFVSIEMEEWDRKLEPSSPQDSSSRRHDSRAVATFMDILSADDVQMTHAESQVVEHVTIAIPLIPPGAP